MRYVITILTALLLLGGCSGRQERPSAPQHFTTDVLLKTTPVKDQGQSSLCWVYAMLATIETEHLMQGDSVHLSHDYVARHLLNEQARRYYLTQGRQPISMRGMATTLINRIMRDGLLAYDSYHADACNYNTVQRKLMKIGDNCISRRSGLDDYQQKVDGLLNDIIRPVPRFQFMFGAEYTAREFAHSVCRPHEYTALTSFTHHPYGERFVLEVPDNREQDTFLNVPPDSLLRRTERALRQGHPVCWEGDISEPGFRFDLGTATVSLKTTTAMQLAALRQTQFERFLTTDDHCMEIVGMAHDRQGNNYFICKNSWGTDNPYGGFIYMSYPYFLLKTIAVVLPE